MAATDVFRPTDGPIYMKGNLSHGLGSDVFESQKYVPLKRPMTQGSRPSTSNRSRFGGLSVNSFFARHNPQSKRVTHLKGLLDVPICSVSDDLHIANPRYSLQFPPNNHNNIKIQNYSRYYNLPANAINTNTPKYPINTITGLQYFLGKPLNFRVTSNTMKPRRGMGEPPEVWRDELKAMMAECGLAPSTDPRAAPVAAPQPGTPAARPRTQYSETTGRLIPPPSRAMSRGVSRQSGRRDTATLGAQIGLEGAETEDMVMTLLCQILQTEDLSAVQSWLVNSGDREKTLVQDLIRAALSTQEDYYHQPAHVQDYLERQERERPVTGTIGDDSDPLKKIDRLTLEPSSPRPRTVEPAVLPPIGQEQTEYRPPTSNTFRAASRQSSRPASRGPRTPQSARPETPARLKYTQGEQAETWNQGESTVQC